MDKKKIDILKKIQEDRDINSHHDYGTIVKQGFDKRLVKSMVNDGLLGFGGTFYLTDKGDKILRGCLIIESGKSSPKNKIMFDSNVFDDILNGKIKADKLEEYKHRNNAEFYITHVQLDEINECNDKEKRAKLFLFMGKIRPIIIPTSSFVWKKSRLGEARLGDGIVFNELKKGNIKHTKDALIGETAIKEGITLVTNDKTLQKRVVDAGGKALLLEYFYSHI